MPPTLTYATPTERDAAATIAVILFITAASPAVALLLGVHADAIAATFYLGHFPSYNNPDPETLPGWLSIPSILLVPTLFLWPFLLPALLRRWGISQPAQLLSSLVLFIFAWTFFLLDPLGVLSWIID